MEVSQSTDASNSDFWSRFQFKRRPWDHQLDAIKRAARLSHFGLFFEMGTGKTATTVNILRYKYMANRGLLRTLILAPPIVLENWKREFALNSNVDAKQITVLYGEGKKRLAMFQERSKYPQIFITNFESLYMKELLDAIMHWNPEVLVVDESHKCKDIKSKRTKAVIQLADKATYRYILTGTPVLNSPMDLFAQFRILDRGSTFGQNFYVFQRRYFYDKNAGMPSAKHFPDWRIKPGSIEEISRIIKTFTARVKKEECLTLPDLVRKQVFVELTPQQRTHYNEMKRDYITYVNGEAVSAPLALTKALRLQQIASGYFKTEDGKEIRVKSNPRQEALKEILAEVAPNHKVLIWAVFKENYEQIKEVCDQLKLKFVEVHGEVGGKAQREAVDEFNTDPEIRVFIGHPESGGIGINLVAASYTVFYSRGFSWAQDTQAESRNHRGGSEIHKQIVRIDLIAKDTIDEIVQERLERKESISERILSDELQRA